MQEFFIGTYTFKGGEGLYRVGVSKEGISVLDASHAQNPSYVCLNKAGTRLYAAIETGRFLGEHGGGVRAYEVNADGSLTLMNELCTKGGGTCHVSLSLDERWLFAANYGEGTGSVIALNPDGSLREMKRHIIHKGRGANPRRQERPHMHFSSISPDGKWLAYCDLGLDGVFLYPFDEQDGVCDPCVKLEAPAGYGPRHLVFAKDGKTIYVLTEMGARILVFRGHDNQWTMTQVVDTLPKGADDEKRWGAAIKFSPDGKYVITSNRGHESMSVFLIGEDGKLEMTQNLPVQGKTPRDFAFSKDGDFVLVACQDEGGLRLLGWNGEKLEETGKGLDLYIPVGVAAR